MRSFYTEKEEYGFIQGIKEGTVCTMTLDYEVLAQLPLEAAEPVPTQTHLLAITSVDDIEGLIPG